MNLEIGKILTDNELVDCEHFNTFGNFDIYIHYSCDTFIFAVDNHNLICGCFEFHEGEDCCQLAHMHVLSTLKRKGIGKAIISEAVDLWGVFLLPSTNSEDTYHYIENGLSFIHSCFDCGILTDPPFMRPDSYVVI